MEPPKTRDSDAWTRAGLPDRFKKIAGPSLTVAGGTCAEVVKGWDTERDCYVAVKKSHKHLDPDTLRREYESMGELQHPNVLTALAYGRRDKGIARRDRSYLVSEWINGPTLLAGGLGPAPRQVLLGVFSGLAYLHRAGVLHGDVHEANILREGNRAVIVDLGLAYPLKSAYDIVPERLGWNPTHCELESAVETLQSTHQDACLAKALKGFLHTPLALSWARGEPPAESALKEHALFQEPVGARQTHISPKRIPPIGGGSTIEMETAARLKIESMV